MVKSEAVELNEVLVVGGSGVDGVSGKAEVGDRIAPDSSVGVWGVWDFVDDDADVGRGVSEVAGKVGGENLFPVARGFGFIYQTIFDTGTKVHCFIEVCSLIGEVKINGCDIVCGFWVGLAQPEPILSVLRFVPAFTHMYTLWRHARSADL